MVAGVELPDGRALTPSAPQARHHFTRLDQIDQLVEASEADAELGFMARLLALCSLPRTNPGDRLQFKRANGPYKLIMTATGDAKLPYGTLPRLLLAWVCTEAVRTQNRELVLGRSLYEFMQKLGILSSDSGGVTGIRTRLRNQMQRLFGCTVSLLYEDARVATTMNALDRPPDGVLVEGPSAGYALVVGEQDRTRRGFFLTRSSGASAINGSVATLKVVTEAVSVSRSHAATSNSLLMN